MKLKNIALGISVAAMAVATVSCGSPAKNELRLNVEQVNKECPIDLGSTGVLESARYVQDDNEAVFTYVINEDDGTDIASLSKVSGEQKAFMTSFLQGESGNQFLGLLVRADAALTFVYRGESSNDSVSVTLTSAELKDIAASEVSDNNRLEQLERIIAITNGQCPSVIDEGLTMTAARLEGNYIVFYYDIDSDVVSIREEDVDEFAEATREALREELTDASGLSQLELMKECGIGTKYVYTPSDSTTPVVIEITPEEVAKF